MISLLDPFDERWISCVESFPRANIFHHPAWVSLLSECYGYRAFVISAIDDTDCIIAGLPILDVNSFLTGRRWVSLPFTDYCQPLYRDQNAIKDLTLGLASLCKDKQYPQIEVRWELPIYPNIQSFSHYVQHAINLEQDIESISKSLHRTQRQNIKTAEKNGVEISRGANLEYLQKFYKLHCRTRRRQGVPVQPWRFFELILDRIIKKGNGFILLANKGDQCLAAGLFLNWHQTLCYKYAASDDSDQNLRPNHLLTWEAIRWGCENGHKVFDFGRTDLNNEGLRTFKCRWGAEETPLYYSRLSEKTPQPSTGRMTLVMNMVIRNSPLWVCRTAGEVLYKHFG